MLVKIGMYYTAYGETKIEVPDSINKENLPEYLNEHIDTIPLPKITEYVDDSAQIDEENIKVINA